MEIIRENPSSNQSGIVVPMNRLIPRPIKVQEKISTAGINQPKACFRVFLALIVGFEGKEEDFSGSGLLNER